MLYRVIGQKPYRMEKVMDQYNGNCGLCVESSYMNETLHLLKFLKMHQFVTHCILPLWPISTVIYLRLFKAQCSSKIEYYLKAQNYRNYMSALNKEIVFLIYHTSYAWSLTCSPLNTKFITMSAILCCDGLILSLWSWVRLFVFICMNSFRFLCAVIKFRTYCKPVFWMMKRFFFFLWLLLSFACECIFAKHQIWVTKATDNF